MNVHDSENISAILEDMSFKKTNVLEEVISKVSALPNTVEERINILENRVEDIEKGEFVKYDNEIQQNSTQVFTNASLEQKVIKLENRINLLAARDAVGNAKLIRKLERQLRNMLSKED